MAVEQPVPPPATWADFAALAESGRLVSAAGSPLVLRACPTCRNRTLGETCPQTVPCPGCSAGPRQPCVRPSGHAYVGGGFHAERLDRAALVDAERQAAGDPTVPAAWPAAQPSLF